MLDLLYNSRQPSLYHQDREAVQGKAIFPEKNSLDYLVVPNNLLLSLSLS